MRLVLPAHELRRQRAAVVTRRRYSKTSSREKNGSTRVS